MNLIRKFFQHPYLYLFVVIIGVTLKFVNIDNRLFWEDEMSTVMHTSGIPLSEYSGLVPLNEIRSITYFTDLVHLNKQDYTPGSQLKGLFTDTHLTPLHYVFLILWHRVAGDDFVSYRLFSVFIFIITLPVLFNLARILFKSKLAGWITISLYSVSPVFHLFAQEARYYMLWAFFIIVLHYLFLKVIADNKLKWWIAYAVTGILAMYTSVISGIAVFGHLAYILAFEKKLVKTYSINILIILLCYLPWIYSMYINRHEIFEAMSWQINIEHKLNIAEPLMYQLMGFAHTFIYLVDWSQITSASDFILTPLVIISMASWTIMMALVIVAFIYFLRRSTKEIRYFLLLVVLPLMLFYYVLDIARNGWLSVIWRYHAISLVGIILIMTYFISRKILLGKLFYSGVYILLIISGIFSIFEISDSRCWMTRNDCLSIIEDARLFSDASSPLIITDFSLKMGGFMVILAECGSENIDILYASPDIDDVRKKIYGKEYSEVFVVHSSDQLVQNLRSQFGEKMDSLEYKREIPMWKINMTSFK